MGSVGIEMNNSVSLLLRTKISLWISGIRRLLYKVLVLINNAAATLSIFATLLFSTTSSSPTSAPKQSSSCQRRLEVICAPPCSLNSRAFLE